MLHGDILSKVVPFTQVLVVGQRGAGSTGPGEPVGLGFLGDPAPPRPAQLAKSVWTGGERVPAVLSRWGGALPPDLPVQ